MKKNQLILAVGGGVSAVLVIGSAALAFLGLSGASAAREARDKAKKDLEKHYRADPFPSEENVEASRANLEDAVAWIDELDDALTVGTNDWARGIDLRRATPGEFSSLREETIQGLYDAAPVGEDGSKIVSDSCAFGFDRYSSGDPAQTPHVRRLIRQLRLVDQLVRLLYAAGPQRVDAVGRVVFETGAGSSDDPSGGRSRGRGRNRPSAAVASGARDTTIAVAPPRPQDGPVPSDVERFGFRFVARENAVLAFLDSIDAMKPYASVTGFSMEKLADDVIFPGEEPEKSSAGRRGAKAEEPAVPQGGPPKPPPRASRMVSGPLREAPVLATVFVDVRFVGADPAGGPGSREEEE